MKHGKNFGILIILSFLFTKVNAQESLINEISYTYLDTLITLAKENYPRVKALDKQIGIAQDNVTKIRRSWLEPLNVGYLYNPRNTFNLSSTGGGGSSFFNGLQLGFSLNIGQIIEKPAQIRTSLKDLDIANLNKEEYELNLIFLVKERYYTYLQQKLFVKLSLQTFQDVENSLKILRLKFEKGEETLQNYNTALILYSNNNQSKIAAESQLLIAKAHLEELIGRKLEDLVQ